MALMKGHLRPERCDLNGTKALVDAAKAKGGSCLLRRTGSLGLSFLCGAMGVHSVADLVPAGGCVIRGQWAAGVEKDSGSDVTSSLIYMYVFKTMLFQ